jgi:hypothetical protein
MNVSFKRLSMLLMFGLMISPTPTHAEDIEAQNVAIQKKHKDPTGISKSAKKTGGDMKKALEKADIETGGAGSLCASDNSCIHGNTCRAGTCLGGVNAACAADADCNHDFFCEYTFGSVQMCARRNLDPGAECSDDKACKSNNCDRISYMCN